MTIIVEDSMPIVTGGVDTHLEVHVAAALNEIGGLLGVESFEATGAGEKLLLRWLRSFGKYSYALYVLHVPIGKAIAGYVYNPIESPIAGSIILSTTLFVLLAMTVVWVASFMSWHLYEKHFLALKRYFDYR